MNPILIVLIGVAVVVGGILALRLHAFLSLIAGASVVGLLAPPTKPSARDWRPDSATPPAISASSSPWPRFLARRSWTAAQPSALSWICAVRSAKALRRWLTSSAVSYWRAGSLRHNFLSAHSAGAHQQRTHKQKLPSLYSIDCGRSGHDAFAGAAGGRAGAGGGAAQGEAHHHDAQQGDRRHDRLDVRFHICNLGQPAMDDSAAQRGRSVHSGTGAHCQSRRTGHCRHCGCHWRRSLFPWP